LNQDIAGMRLRALDGRETWLSDYRGKVLVLDFRASWGPASQFGPSLNGGGFGAARLWLMSSTVMRK